MKVIAPGFQLDAMLAVQLCHCHHTHYYSVLSSLSSAVPLDVALNTRIVGTANSGEVKYYNFPFHSSGITFRVDVDQGSVVAYASDVTEAPNTQRGNVWQIQTTSYDDLFLDPLPLGRAAGSTVHVAVEGMHSSNSFVIGAVAGNATTSSEIIYKINMHLFLILPYVNNMKCCSLSLSSVIRRYCWQYGWFHSNHPRF